MQRASTDPGSVRGLVPEPVPEIEPAERPERRTWSLFARELLLVVVVYGAYWLVRNLLGDDAELAARNADRLFDIERALGLDWERGAQSLLDHHRLMQVLNAFYGITHFGVTAGLLVWLYLRRDLHTYVRWRTVLLATTVIALLGYAAFPLMPPRLLPGTGIIDALAVHGAPWDYHHGPISELSNQYAAMPSVHVAWALWCTLVVWTTVGGDRRAAGRVARAAAVAYSALAAVAVVATGNHWVLDIVGAVVVIALGLAATQLGRGATWISTSSTRRRS